MKKKISIGLLCLALIAITSCSDQDEYEPVIGSISINGTTSQNLHVIAGEENVITVVVNDDQALKQMKVDISTLSGIHQHESEPGEIPHASLQYNQGVWDTLSIVNLSGQSSLETFTFQIPDTVSGNWSMEISVLDERGNIVTEEFDLKIQNDNLPVISFGTMIPSPDGEGHFTLSGGDSLSLAAVTFDGDSLASVSVVVDQGSTLWWSQEWTDIASWTFDLSQVDIPPFTDSGDYTIHIYSTDTQGWYNHVVVYVEVL